MNNTSTSLSFIRNRFPTLLRACALMLPLTGAFAGKVHIYAIDSLESMHPAAFKEITGSAYSPKTLVAFDIDGTLADITHVSKSYMKDLVRHWPDPKYTTKHYGRTFASFDEVSAFYLSFLDKELKEKKVKCRTTLRNPKGPDILNAVNATGAATLTLSKRVAPVETFAPDAREHKLAFTFPFRVEGFGKVAVDAQAELDTLGREEVEKLKKRQLSVQYENGMLYTSNRNFKAGALKYLLQQAGYMGHRNQPHKHRYKELVFIDNEWDNFEGFADLQIYFDHIHLFHLKKNVIK